MGLFLNQTKPVHLHLLRLIFILILSSHIRLRYPSSFFFFLEVFRLKCRKHVSSVPCRTCLPHHPEIEPLIKFAAITSYKSLWSAVFKVSMFCLFSLHPSFHSACFSQALQSIIFFVAVRNTDSYR
jgi:hypothetical protein